MTRLLRHEEELPMQSGEHISGRGKASAGTCKGEGKAQGGAEVGVTSHLLGGS